MATKKKVTNGTLVTIVYVKERENGPGSIVKFETPVREVSDADGRVFSEFGQTYCALMLSGEFSEGDDYTIDWDLFQIHKSPFTRENKNGDLVTSDINWLVPK